MTYISVRCPHCRSDHIVKRGKTGWGTQRSLCQNAMCATGSFLLDDRDLGRLPEVKHQIIDMRLNASGGRDTARVLRISTDTVLRARREKEATLESVHTAFLCIHNPDDIAVAMERAGAAEMEERWSFVGNKDHPRWLWHTIDHHPGAVLASVFGRRKAAVFLQRKTLLEPFGLSRFSPDHGGAYTRHPAPDVHRPGKKEHAKDRAQAPDIADTDATLGPEDDLLLQIDADARHRYWLVCQPLGLWVTGLQ